LDALLESASSETNKPITYHYHKNAQPEGLYEAERTLMRPLHNKLYDRIRNLFSPAPKVLEIGAGKITSTSEGIHSYVSHFFSYSDWTFSDKYDPKYAPNANYKQFDLTKNSETSLESYDCVIGSQVLDTIRYDKLSSVLETISRLVKPNGFFIHLADLNYFFARFLNACVSENPDSIFLPGSRPNFDSPFNLLKIEKVAYNQILQSSILETAEMELLESWGKTPSYTLVKAINICLYTDKSYKNKEIEDRIREIFGSAVKKISIEDPFENSLKKAAEENGFKVIQSEAIADTILVDATYSTEKEKVLGEPANSIFLRNGCLQWFNSSSVPKGKVSLSGNIRIRMFIAKNVKQL
jgi:hypothetical protein